MSTFQQVMGFSCQCCFAPSDAARGSGEQAEPVTLLRDALQNIETAAYDLADKHPADIISQLILLAAELERVISTLAPPARRRASREN